jgi:hypothetical protein
MTNLGTPNKRGGGIWKVLLALVILAGLGAGAVVSLRAGEAPTVSVSADKAAVGKGTVFTVSAAEPKRGLTSLKVVLVQGTLTKELEARVYVPQPPWGVGPSTPSDGLQVTVGKSTVPELREGEVTVRVLAEGAGTWLKPAPKAEAEATLPVRLTPPTLDVRSEQIYPAQGGCEVVIYAVGPSSTRDGVQAGAWFFPGYPLPGGAPDERFAVFAVPYDMGDDREVKLVAGDDVGNVAEAAFIDRFTPRPFATDTIRVSKEVMEKVVPKILSRVPDFADRGDLVQNYVAINSELRKANNQVLVALAARSRPEFMWRAPFVQMNAKAVSAFADRRTYYFEERQIDQQDHLGFDLASTKRAPIPAANRGVVVLAGYLGIYGNAVVLDHGYGLMSLYGHLSELSVKEGDVVERAQTIGRTGATGLALGDHLHFTMLLHGLPVTPLEWWDGHWIQDRIAKKLGAALPLVLEDSTE